MPTGDGLLVRLRPIGTIPLAAFAALCRAARRHGNGIVEVTSRGSVQVRGLSAAAAPQFAAAVAAAGIAVEDGVAVVCTPLAGLDAGEQLDAEALAADLRRALASTSLAARLAAKVAVAIDGGGALNLDAVGADLRLRAAASSGGALLRISVGGDGARAFALGAIAPPNAVEAVLRLLHVIAQRSGAARARTVVAAEGIDVFRAPLTGLLVPSAKTRASLDNARAARSRANAHSEPHRSDQAIGRHRLRDGSFACGVGLAFGHVHAALLEHLVAAAAAAGASGIRAAPGRVLMGIALAAAKAPAFTAEAEQLGFVIRADDPRRSVIACAGAPLCAAAHIAARAMAARVAETAAAQIDGSFKIHISGCTKGCAHPAAAALTVVGTPDGCALIANGSARAPSFAVVGTDALPVAVAEYVDGIEREADHV
jgi:precorrin-3B synthase